VTEKKRWKSEGTSSLQKKEGKGRNFGWGKKTKTKEEGKVNAKKKEIWRMPLCLEKKKVDAGGKKRKARRKGKESQKKLWIKRCNEKKVSIGTEILGGEKRPDRRRKHKGNKNTLVTRKKGKG